MTLHPHVEEGRSRYRQGCRCVACKASVAEYQRLRRQLRKQASNGTTGQETPFPAIPVGSNQ